MARYIEKTMSLPNKCYLSAQDHHEVYKIYARTSSMHRHTVLWQHASFEAEILLALHGSSIKHGYTASEKWPPEV
jgi:hypothetical protein